MAGFSLPSPLVGEGARALSEAKWRRVRGNGAKRESVTPHPASRTCVRSATLSHKGRGKEIARAPRTHSISNYQTATPLRPRCGNPARASTSFISLPRVVLPPKEGAERRMAQSMSVPLQGARDRSCDGPASPYGAPLRRLQSLVPHFLSVRRLVAGWREGVKDIDPRPRNGPGGCPPRTPGTTVCENRGRRRRSPSTLKFACRAPLGEWGCVQSSGMKQRSASRLKFFPKGVPLARRVPVVGCTKGQFATEISDVRLLSLSPCGRGCERMRQHERGG